jgi:hypothetical protein
MKIIATADLHMTTAQPVNRTDDYEATVIDKFNQILGFAMQHGAILTISGDLWDTAKLSKVPYELTNKILQMIRLSKVRILACHGQHDMTYHNPNLQTSPYYTLLVGGGIEIPGPMGIIIDGVRFYGAGWGQQIVMPPEKNDDIADVLLLHRTITPLEPPFYLKDATSAQIVLEKLYNYDLILSGDFHESFLSEMEGRFLVNPGPMLRASVDKRDYRPRVYLIDTETAEINPIFLKIKDDVWNDDRIEKQAQHDISITTNGLRDAMARKEDRPNFFKILDGVVAEANNNDLAVMTKEILTTAQKNLEGIR